MTGVVLCDIDHCVADSAWRDSLVTSGGRVDWDSWHRLSEDDRPIQHVVDLVNALVSAGMRVHGLTTRPEKWRALTTRWLLRVDCRFCRVLMRPNDDYRPAPVVKVDVARAAFPGMRDEIALVIDDRDDVSAAFRAEGIVVLQCHAYATHAPSVPFDRGEE